MTWTRFDDCHSGGGTKLGDLEVIFIQEKEEVARVVFYNRFGRNADKVTCTCCGPDYSVSEKDNLGDFHEFGKNTQRRVDALECEELGISYQDDEMLIIPDCDVKDDERFGEVREQGYVWVE